jgi:serine/threonine-protein kinase PRP4
MSTSSGYKRVRDDAPSFEGGLPYGDDTPASVAAGNGDASRKEKPKDWRQAFLDEDAAQERRERERRREGNGSRGHERERERERSRDRGGRSHRDRSERASSRTDSRPSKPTNSRPARLDMDGEAEEGE